MTATEKIFNRIKRQTGKAIGDFSLIKEGDRIAVGLSGGKDSYTLLHILEALRKKAPINFELFVINIDSGFPGYHKELLEQHLQQHHFNYVMAATNSYRIIEEKLRPGTSYCALCARLRRGILYTQAEKLDCNIIALGHHLDDFIETLLLNQFYGGALAAMSARLQANNGKHTVIRPLVYVQEAEIQKYSDLKKFPIIHCSCPVVGGEDQKRQQMKQLIQNLTEEIPEIRSSMISAIGNIHPRHLLDQKLTKEG
ncbi:MAG: tRNA 2-thiocytidine(32) synthetase TtcA [Thermodesulfobacteriota bacterium]|nr:tRNA 2-thiocytidine(32) synthetase TtcA [Thermodesulfobacteriota bacterium]